MFLFDSFADISAGVSEAALAAFLRVSIPTIRNYRSGATRAPHAALALTHLWLGGDMGAVWGRDWEGFCLRPDAFFHPFWRRGFSAGELKAFFFQIQTLTALERDNARLGEELAAERARALLARSMAGRTT